MDELFEVIRKAIPENEMAKGIRNPFKALETIEAEVARLTDPAMKCRECPFNLTADLATRDELIRELVEAFRKERTISPCDFCFNDDGDMKGCVGGINDDVKCQWYEARATLTRARALLKGQGEQCIVMENGCCDHRCCYKPAECKFAVWQPIRNSYAGGVYRAGSDCPAITKLAGTGEPKEVGNADTR